MDLLLAGNVVGASIEAVGNAIEHIRLYQRKEKDVGQAEIKSHDQTLLTRVDYESSEIIVRAFKGLLEKGLVRLEVEDLKEKIGLENLESAPITVLVDSLDGTGAFVSGLPTSAVVVAGYDVEQRRLVSSVVGEPATGRIWVASPLHGRPIFILADNPHPGPTLLSVWPGSLDSSCRVFLDVSHGFKVDKGMRQVLTDEQVAGLFARLSKEVGVLIPGSNLLQQVLVASGYEKVVGAYMTAKGGPWDACGVLHVLKAGGAAMGFSVDGGTLHCVDPLDVMAYDLLVVANNVQSLNWLIDKLNIPVVYSSNGIYSSNSLFD